jgi:chemotaxis protein methyltransferase CheR
MPLTVSEMEYVRGLLHREAAIVLEPEKSYRAEAALEPLARQEGFATVAELVRSLQTGPPRPAHRRAVEAMTVNETSFFRDQYPYEALRSSILPDLIRRRADRKAITIWSAACSTGQEPYSIAMTILEHFPELASWDVRIIASDLSDAVLEIARQARYRQIDVNRGLPAHLLVRYFTRQGLEWEVRPEVRRLVRFDRVNLIGPWPFMAGVDVVFLRNVMIYFDDSTKRGLLERVRRLVGPGGALVLGGAETTLLLTDAFERVPAGRHSYYRALAGPGWVGGVS